MDHDRRAPEDALEGGSGRGDARAEEDLSRALGALFEGAAPPPSIAEALARAACEQAERRRLRLLVGAGALAAAAGLVALAGLRIFADPDPDPSAPRRTFDIADVDRSGRVDVWDAYLVARAVEAGERRSGPDLDGDGEVTRADADLVARRAVEVPR